MTPLIKVHKQYVIRKPIEEVINYLTNLEEHRKRFEADINGGIVATDPPTFAFTIPIIAFSKIRTRTLIHATLRPNEDKTALQATLTPNIAFVLMASIGVVATIVAFFKSESSQALLKGIGSGIFIIAIACVLDVISKKVVLGTFERCLHDIHKRRTAPTSRNGS
ncbi:MAG TPA: hypothetical protein VD794_11460 [Flavisolibacter sp.]|nr:hypothetical protein [Flavisolibacter sp.]